MGFKFSSFAAGAAKALTDTLKKDEEEAVKIGVFGVKALKENYDKMQAENLKLENKLLKNKEILKTFDSTATDAELFAAATNDAFMDMAVKAAQANPASFRVGDYVKIREANPSNRSFEESMKAYTTIPEVSRAARQVEGNVAPQKPEGFFGIGALRNRVSERAGSKAEEQTAKAMGVSLEQLRGASGARRPEFDTGATFDFTSMQKQPSNAKDIKDKLEVSVIQSAQKFGENSPEYIDAKKKFDVVDKKINELAGVVDKNQDARAERLMLERLDTKDPARIKEIDTALTGIRESIKLHKKLTTIADPKEKEATYNAMKTDVSDYVNTRMRDAKGTKWRNMVDFKTYTDEATGKTITSKTTKVDMTPEQQQEMFAVERKLTAQALKDNGYVLLDGTPRTPVAERLMRNFNITANDLAVNAPAAAEQSSPTANASAAPAAAQSATPAKARPVPQLTREDQEALVWANTPANAGYKADAIKKKIQNKINGTN